MGEESLSVKIRDLGPFLRKIHGDLKRFFRFFLDDMALNAGQSRGISEKIQYIWQAVGLPNRAPAGHFHAITLKRLIKDDIEWCIVIVPARRGLGKTDRRPRSSRTVRHVIGETGIPG